MENAVEALKMAAAVLIFIIAIASSFSLFGTAKQTADSIITIRDKQAYLQAAELDGGILYTSSSAIQGTNEELTDVQKKEVASIGGVTRNGDRIVGIADVISTIYRYSIEKYGVTILKENGDVIARYDSNTEQVMSIWSSVDGAAREEYIKYLKDNTRTEYSSEAKFTEDILEKLYKIKIFDKYTVGAPWYGNQKSIQARVACDFYGGTCEYNDGKIKYEGIKYGGESLSKILKGKTIVEVTNEIDNSTYLTDGGEKTNLLQEYEMPTVEVVYIILN